MKTKSIASLEALWSKRLNTKVNILLARNIRVRNGEKRLFMLAWIPMLECYIVGAYTPASEYFRLYRRLGDDFFPFDRITDDNCWKRSGELVKWIRESLECGHWLEGPRGFLEKVKEYLE